jgi:hypothetical protein
MVSDLSFGTSITTLFIERIPATGIYEKENNKPIEIFRLASLHSKSCGGSNIA